MKILRNCLLLLLSALFLTGCQGNVKDTVDKDSLEATKSLTNTSDDEGISSQEPAVEKVATALHVVTTFFVPYELARNVGGELADVHILAALGENPAEYQLGEEDRALLEACDVFVYSGGVADRWAEEALEFLREDAETYSFKEGMEHLIANGVSPDFFGTGLVGENEIYWVVPVNAMLLSSDISEVFAKKDPIHMEIYDRNFSAYLDELSEVDQELTEALGQISEREFLFVGRTSYMGLAEEYQFHYHAATEEAEIEALTDKLKSEGAGCFFYDELSEKEWIEALHIQTDAEPLLFYSGIMSGQEDMEDGRTFVDLLRRNAENMKTAFSSN